MSPSSLQSASEVQGGLSKYLPPSQDLGDRKDHTATYRTNTRVLAINNLIRFISFSKKESFQAAGEHLTSDNEYF